MQAWEEARPFKDIVLADPALTAHLSPDEIEDAFDARYHLRHVDLLFERVGL
jgi:adenylosuccinate lyase